MQGLKFLIAFGIIILSWIVTYYVVDSLPEPRTVAHALLSLCVFIVLTGVLSVIIFRIGKDEQI